MRKLLLAALVAALGLAAACEPIELTMTVRRDGTVESGDRTEVTLRGRITCSQSEPVDLFLHLDQGSTSFGTERSVPCQENEATRLQSAPFDFPAGFPVAGDSFVRLRACTNTERNDDCVTVERVVSLS